MTNDTDFRALVNRFLSKYFASQSEIKQTKLGNANANFIIANSGNKFFFRIYLPINNLPRKRKVIEEEFKVINWFSKKGFPVAKALPTLNDETLIEYKGYYGALFEYIEGKHVYGTLNKKHFNEIGKLIGRAHSETEKSKLICDKKWEEGSFWNKVFVKAEKSTDILSKEDIELTLTLKDKVSELEDVPQYLIHGDYHFANTLFNESDELVGLLDFDDYRMGHFVDDIIRSFVCELIYTPIKYYEIKKVFVAEFWRGYTEYRQLSSKEIELVSLYLKLHYLSGYISLLKTNKEKVEGFKTMFKSLEYYTSSVFKNK